MTALNRLEPIMRNMHNGMLQHMQFRNGECLSFPSSTAKYSEYVVV